jgi:hypothetical protein
MSDGAPVACPGDMPERRHAARLEDEELTSA